MDDRSRSISRVHHARRSKAGRRSMGRSARAGEPCSGGAVRVGAAEGYGGRDQVGTQDRRAIASLERLRPPPPPDATDASPGNERLAEERVAPRPLSPLASTTATCASRTWTATCTRL